MTVFLPDASVGRAFVQEVDEKGELEISACYQCGKCTAGCPVAFEMDFPPNQVVRGVQLGLRDEVLSSHTIWLCAACETCTTRCPQGVEVAGMMDRLRHIARAEGIKSSEPEISIFHRLFLGSVKTHGRIFEVGMMAFLNLFSGHYVKDVIMAPGMFLKGKLSLLPPRHGNIAQVRRMFDKARELEAKAE